MTLKTARVDELFAQWNKPNSPGCAVAVIKDGELIYKQGYGIANLEYGIPISSTSVFDIGSISKQFTAMCISLLARQGRLSLDDEIQAFIPEMPRYKHSIALRHLIHHTSGIRDYIDLMYFAGMRLENAYSHDEILKLIARQKELDFEPGEAYSYSNSGYFLLAEIVKRVSGKSLRVFADKNLFIPLQMKATHFHDAHTEIVRNRAIGYSSGHEGEFRIDMSIFNVVGAGGLHTTVEDLFLWEQNFYHNQLGGYGQALIEEAITPGKLNSGESVNYGFGLVLSSYQGLKMIGHNGRWMGYGAELLCFPDQRCTIICLYNSIHIPPSALQIADIYLAEDFIDEDKTSQDNQQFVELPVSEIENKVGFYRNIKDATIWELTLQEEKLVVEGVDISFQIASLSQNHYQSKGIPLSISVEFEEQSLGGTFRMYIRIKDEKPDIFEKLNPVVLSDEQLAEYSGNYYSEELDVNYRFSVGKGHLLITHKNLSNESLKLVTHDVFKGSYPSFDFIRNERNQVTGFNLSARGMKNIYFVKQ